jgi:hypothetical protein
MGAMGFPSAGTTGRSANPLPTHPPGRYHSACPDFANSVSRPEHWGVLKFLYAPILKREDCR